MSFKPMFFLASLAVLATGCNDFRARISSTDDGISKAEVAKELQDDFIDGRRGKKMRAKVQSKQELASARQVQKAVERAAPTKVVVEKVVVVKQVPPTRVVVKEVASKDTRRSRARRPTTHERPDHPGPDSQANAMRAAQANAHVRP